MLIKVCIDFLCIDIIYSKYLFEDIFLKSFFIEVIDMYGESFSFMFMFVSLLLIILFIWFDRLVFLDLFDDDIHC